MGRNADLQERALFLAGEVGESVNVKGKSNRVLEEMVRELENKLAAREGREPPGTEPEAEAAEAETPEEPAAAASGDSADSGAAGGEPEASLAPDPPAPSVSADQDRKSAEALERARAAPQEPVLGGPPEQPPAPPSRTRTSSGMRVADHISSICCGSRRGTIARGQEVRPGDFEPAVLEDLIRRGAIVRDDGEPDDGTSGAGDR